jgi:hypothetical protein
LPARNEDRVKCESEIEGEEEGEGEREIEEQIGHVDALKRK